MRVASNIYFSKRFLRVSLGASLMSTLAGCASEPESRTTLSSNPVIVRLFRRHDVITITAGLNAPLYTVVDGSGRVLVSEMSMPELKRTRPDLYEQISPAVAPTAEAWAGE
jgi:hypothetical protein